MVPLIILPSIFIKVPRPRKQKHPRKLDPLGKIEKEIMRLQGTTNLLIPRAPFQRLVREMMQSVAIDRQYNYDFRIKLTAMEALREATELYLCTIFEDAWLLSLHAGRVTLKEKDVRLLLMLWKQFVPNLIPSSNT